MYGSSKDIVSDSMQKYAVRRSYRGTAETRWNSISKYILPRLGGGFFNASTVEGQNFNQYNFSLVGVIALSRCVSAILSTVAPQTQQWHGLEASDPELNKDREVRKYLDEATQLMFRRRYSVETSFQSRLAEVINMCVAFGTGVMYTEANYRTKNVDYISTHLAEHFFVQNPNGIIEDNIRYYKMTPQQAVQAFGDNPLLPEQVRTLADRSAMNQIDFMHCVHPNPEYIPGTMAGPRSFKYRSYHICATYQTLLSEGGYHTFPYHIFRMRTTPNEHYGRGLGDDVLEELRIMCEIRKTDLNAAMMAANGPTLAINDLRGAPQPRPNMTLYGGLNPQTGRPNIMPYNSMPYPNISTERLEQCYKTVNEAFMLPLFQVMVDDRFQTATEIRQRSMERGMMFIPTLSALQTDSGLSSLIERELDIAMQFDALPPPPDVLVASGGKVDIRFTAPLNRLQRTADMESARALIEQAAVVEQLQPGFIHDHVDFDAYLKVCEDALGSPPSILYDQDTVAQRRQMREQGQNESQQMAQIPEAATAMKDIAQAQAYAAKVS